MLLDVNMPGLTGYEVCQRLKSNPETAMIPVIFISSMDLPEDRLEGYEVGGDEYIVKPIDEDILTSKIKATLEVQGKYRALQREARDATSIAIEAMTSSSEMGSVIQFMRDCNQCVNLEQLYGNIAEIMTTFGLAISCRMEDGENTLYFDCARQSPEAKIMARCRTSHRIYDFGARTVFSENHISVLVKNMPLTEPNRLGRIKDNMAILINIAEIRIKSILMEMELAGRRNSIVKSLIQVTDENLQKISQTIKGRENLINSILQKLMANLEDKLIFLGLEEDQELALRKLTADSTEEIMRIGSLSDEIISTLTEVLEGLYNLLENRKSYLSI